MTARVACCPDCDEVLVGTFAFPKYEFYCLNCGGRYGWLSPRAKDETPELLARIEELTTEFEENAGKHLINGGLMLDSCAKCKDEHEPHIYHATDEEKLNHEEALNWLRARRRPISGKDSAHAQ